MTDEYHIELRVVKANPGLMGFFNKPFLYLRSATIPEGIKALKQFAETKGIKVE